MPYIMTCHDLIPLVAPELMKTTVQVKYSRWFARGNYAAASHIICDSMWTLNDLIKVFPEYSNNASVIYPGISPVFRPVENFNYAMIEQKYGIRMPFILYIGDISPRKNVNFLIEAMSRPQIDKKYHLVLAGRMGFGMDSPEIMAKRYGIQGRVKFLGFIPAEDQVLLYNMATCLVYPSLYEGFGLPPIEAMACGCPVVSSNATSLQEVVTGGALTFNPDADDAMPKLVSHMNYFINSSPEQREAQKVISTVHAAKFSWKKAAKEIWDLYMKVAK